MSLLTLGRVLALVLGLELAGVAHLADDLVSVVVSGVVPHDEQCPADRPCDDCPPGCPNCHCQNGLPSLVPRLGSPMVLTLPVVAIVAFEAGARGPLGPELSSLFRPPRAELPV